VTPTASERERDLLRVAAGDGVRVTLVSDRVAAALSDTVTPQGVVAVVRPDASDIDTVLAANPRLLAFIVGVADPGNAGTVIRTADAVGADAVILAGGSVDPHNPKCVRASAGSLFNLPVVRADSVATVIDRMHSRSIQVLAATLTDALDLESPQVQSTLGDAVAWLFGNEAHGVPDDVSAAADLQVRIPIHGRAESLNLAAAAAICLYATARVQRANQP
jgi:TrmH family RNA methyltransferase